MKRRLHKVLDVVPETRCAIGPGLIREETWHDEEGKVARYDLTFINHFMSAKDNGRVLGYDNSHGYQSAATSKSSNTTASSAPA